MKDKLVKNSLLVTSGEIASKGLGFARDLVIGGLFGASAQLDAFFVAYNVPGIFVAFLATSLTTAFVPVFFSYKSESGESRKESGEARNEFVANFASCSSLLFGVLSVGIFLGAHWLMKLMAPGFSPAQTDYGVRLIRVFSGCTLLAGLGMFLRTEVQCKGKFGWPALSDVVNNGLVLIFSWLLGRQLGIFGLAYAFILGLVVQTGLLLWAFFRGGGRFTLRLRVREPGFLRVFRLSLPLYVGLLTANLSTIIGRAMASSLTAGSISALTYADKIRSLPITMLGTAVVTVLFPNIARVVQAEPEKNQAGSGVSLDLLLGRVIRLILVISAFVTKVMLILGLPLIIVLLQRGSFTSEAAGMTAQALSVFALGMPAAIMGTILLRVFHANQDTKSPVLIGMVSVMVNILVNLLFVEPLAHRGIALGTSVANWVWFVLLAWQLGKRHKVAIFAPGSGMGSFVLRLLALNTLTGAGVWILAGILSNQGSARLANLGPPSLIAVVLGMAVVDLLGLRLLRLLPRKSAETSHGEVC